MLLLNLIFPKTYLFVALLVEAFFCFPYQRSVVILKTTLRGELLRLLLYLGLGQKMVLKFHTLYCQSFLLPRCIVLKVLPVNIFSGILALLDFE